MSNPIRIASAQLETPELLRQVALEVESRGHRVTAQRLRLEADALERQHANRRRDDHPVMFSRPIRGGDA